MQTDADEIRQILRETGDGTYVLATFTTDRGRSEWTDTAKDYGGHDLVGGKRVAAGRADVILSLRVRLRVRLGGTLEEGVLHGGTERAAGRGPGTCGKGFQRCSAASAIAG
jgi:hypothetical protein